MKVCRAWRKCILDIPSIWARIYLTVDDRKPINSPQFHAPVARDCDPLDYIVSRAQSLPLHIILSISCMENRVQQRKDILTRVIFTHGKKIQTLEMDLTRDTPIDAADNSLHNIFVHPLPLLKDLTLYYGRSCDPAVHQLFQSISQNSIGFDVLRVGHSTECLSKIRCGNRIEILSGRHDMMNLVGVSESLRAIAIHWVLTCSIPINMSRLRSIFVHHVSVDTLSRLQLPALEALHIDHLTASEVSTHPPRSIHFPKLQHLFLEGFEEDVVGLNFPPLIKCHISLERCGGTYLPKMEEIFGDEGCRLKALEMTLIFRHIPTIYELERFSDDLGIRSLKIHITKYLDDAQWTEFGELFRISGKPGARLFPGLLSLELNGREVLPL
jgi:hypothetical protein